ncbi:hypothetical protein HJFPF1_05896 [Paramyrothecium foliicola]|nr:hypothetical protein HJFPF1_05896 [Paramyrothecium foliicola]
MLCSTCDKIAFHPLEGNRLNTHVHILHKNHGSFHESLASGCDFCSLIGAKLDAFESYQDTCHTLQAYIILLCKYNHGRLRAINIATRRGCAIFDVIECIPKNLASDVQTLRLGSKSTLSQPDKFQDENFASLEEKSIKTFVSVTDIRDTNTGSSANLSLARQWLHECRLNHKTCNSNGFTSPNDSLPTRLLDISSRESLILVDTKAASAGPYIALSYCWGHGRRVMTVNANYESHLCGLPSSDLPRTFADAIQVAQNLGYCYIWIDAFCIIQDDADDLNRELPKMGDIYRYADFTIYTAIAASSHTGAFVERNPQAYRPCRLPISIFTDQGDVELDITLATTQNGPDHLEPRGWVLQERILSSRSLMFGQQMAWSCSEASAQETNPVMRPSREHRRTFDATSFRSLIYRAPLSVLSQNPSLSAPFHSWYALVENYSDKLLTQSSDNLKAISGLAALFQQAYGITYMAGLWKEHLHAGLAWYVALNDRRPVTRDDIAPSWSWASVGKVRVAYRNWRGVKEAPNLQICAEILDTDCEPVDLANPYGSLKKGTITMRVHLFEACLYSSEAYAKSRTELSYGSSISRKLVAGLEVADETEKPRHPAVLVDNNTTQIIAEAALDLPEANPLRRSDLGQLGDATMRVWCAPLHIQHVRHDSFATILVLEAAGDKSYKRIGLGFAKLGSSRLEGFTDRTEAITLM